MNLITKSVFIILFLIPFKIIKTENYLLPTNIVPKYYNVLFIFEKEAIEKKEFHGIDEIYFDVIEGSLVKNIQLHSKHIGISSIELSKNNETIPIDEPPYYANNVTDILSINTISTPLSGNDYKLKIIFFGNITKNGVGFFLTTYNENNETKYMIATQLQPTNARQIFPCFDEPKYKARFQFTIINPKKYNVISNSLQNISTIFHDEMRKTVFITTPKMSTYLISIVISEFNCDQKNSSDENIIYEVCSRKSTANMRRLAMNLTSDLLHKLENITNFEYNDSRIGRLTEIALPNFDLEAMENWGSITYRETLLLADNNDADNTIHKQHVALTISHELAHQWFGNLITVDWWTDILLHEGFARYFEYYALHELYPDWQLDKQFVLQVVQDGLLRDTLSTKSLDIRPTTPTDIDNKFDALMYNKGGSLFRMLAYSMNLKNFKLGIQNFIQLYKYNNALLNDLWKTLDPFIILPEALSLQKVMTTWLHNTGFPLLTVGSTFNKIIITQEEFKKSGFNLKWYVPVSYTLSTDKNKFNDTTPKFWLTLNNDSIEIKNVNADWIILNNQQAGFFRVNYSIELWNNISKALNQENFGGIDVISRSQIVDDLLNMVISGRFPDVVKAFDIISFLEVEIEYYPWYSALKAFWPMLIKLRNSRIAKPFRIYILEKMQNFYDSVPFEHPCNNDHKADIKQELAINFACQLGHYDCITRATKSLKNYQMYSQKPNSNIRKFIYCTALKHSRNITKDWDFLWNLLQKNTDPIEHEILLYGLGCVQDKSKIKLLLDEIIKPYSIIIREEASTLLMSMGNAGHSSHEIIYNYVKNNYTQIIPQAGGGVFIEMLKIVGQGLTRIQDIKEFEDFSRIAPYKSNILEISRKAYADYRWILKFENAMKNYFSSAFSLSVNVFILIVCFTVIQLY